MTKTYICKYCGKQVCNRPRNFHAHCLRESQRAIARQRVLNPSDIQEPINCVDTAKFDALIAQRAKEIRDDGLAFIRSRTPVDDSPAAELALRPAGFLAEVDQYLVR